MTHSEVHLAVRNTLRATPFRAFVIVVESVEVESGGVMVEWRIAITGADPIIHLRGRNPYDLLAELRAIMNALRNTDPAPPELDAVGHPPAPRDVA